MKPDFRIPYDHMKFEWISSHYDIHLKGLCRINGTLMRFETEQSHLGYPFKNLRCHVFRLTLKEHIHWKLRQWAFEFCVGTHWTYPDGRRKLYRLRRPKWFWHIIQNLYYKARHA